MRLQWKYALIINLSVLTILVAFYALDEIKARKDLKDIHIQNVENGAIFRNIVEKVLWRVVDQIERDSTFNRDKIENELRSLKAQNSDEMGRVVDIHVTLGRDARIQASLNQELLFSIDLTALNRPGNGGSILDILRPEFENNSVSLSENATIKPKDGIWLIKDHKKTYSVEKEGNRLNVYVPKDYYINFTGYDLFEVERHGVQVYNLVESENGKYATEMIIDYQTGVIVDSRITGFIQVLFEAPDIAKHINDLRLMHLIYVIVVSVLLVIIIDMTTTRLIMRPLERMMEIIKRAEAGDSESLPQSYSSGEMGRVTYSLVRMLKQLTEAHSKRIAALGQLAAGVAHEIRNPLNTIGMTAQHLKDLFSQKDVKPADIKEAQDLLEIVNYEIEHLKRISEQFVTLNRPKALDIESTNLSALLDQVIPEFTLMMEDAKVEVIRNYAANLPLLQLDSGLIRQAIFNLIQNSIQAMAKGGRIYITTKLDQMMVGEGVALEIRDTGIGIPAEIQERIFDAYFTTKESEGGMGLGLAIAHQIITAHQGRIELRSQVGMGTAFKIYFPIPD